MGLLGSQLEEIHMKLCDDIEYVDTLPANYDSDEITNKILEFIDVLLKRSNILKEIQLAHFKESLPDNS